MDQIRVDKNLKVIRKIFWNRKFVIPPK